MFGSATLGGPIGGVVGSAVGNALGSTLGEHGNTGQNVGGSAATGGSAASDPGYTGLGNTSNAQPNWQQFTGLERLASGGLVSGGAAPGAGAASGAGVHRLIKGSGLVRGESPGRADLVPAHLPRGSYVIPADVVSGMGQGNTAAGAAQLGHTLSKLPRYATGRVTLAAAKVSSGEYVVHPAHVTALGAGSTSAGSRKLDALVHHVRAAAVRTALTARPPR